MSTLPEFQHWNDPNTGEEAFGYDAYMLRKQVPLERLFQRGAVPMQWFEEPDQLWVLEGRRLDLWEEEEGHRGVVARYRALVEDLRRDIVRFEEEQGEKADGFREGPGAVVEDMRRDMEFFEEELREVEKRVELCNLRMTRQSEKIGQAAVLAAARERGVGVRDKVGLDHGEGKWGVGTASTRMQEKENGPSAGRQRHRASELDLAEETVSDEGGREDTVPLPSSDQETEEERPVSLDKREIEEEVEDEVEEEDEDEEEDEEEVEEEVEKKDVECLAAEYQECCKQALASLASTNGVEDSGGDIKAKQSESNSEST